MTARDELIARVEARLTRADHVESRSAEVPVSDLRALIALATTPLTDQSAEIARHNAQLDVARETMRDLRALYLAQKAPVAGSYAAAVIGAADEALAQITPGAVGPQDTAPARLVTP